MMWEKLYRFGMKRCLSTKLKKKKLNTPVKGKEHSYSLVFFCSTVYIQG